MLGSCIHWKDCELFGEPPVSADRAKYVECIKSNNSSPVTNLPSIVFRLSSACHETEISIEPDSVPPSERLHIGVVGSGPAGMAFAHTAATIGHLVTIFDKSQEIGGKSEI